MMADWVAGILRRRRLRLGQRWIGDRRVWILPVLLHAMVVNAAQEKKPPKAPDRVSVEIIGLDDEVAGSVRR